MAIRKRDTAYIIRRNSNLIGTIINNKSYAEAKMKSLIKEHKKAYDKTFQSKKYDDAFIWILATTPVLKR